MFVNKMVDDPHYVFLALMTLGMASENNLYGKQALLDLIEKKTRNATRTDGSLLAIQYAYTLHLGTPNCSENELRNSNKIIFHGSPSSFNSGERSQCEKWLRDSRRDVDRFASELFAQKRGMDSKTYGWVKAQVQSRIRRYAGATKQYWQYIGRVTTYRNARPKN